MGTREGVHGAEALRLLVDRPLQIGDEPIERQIDEIRDGVAGRERARRRGQTDDGRYEDDARLPSPAAA
jgi:hypothetical protein